MGVSKRENRPRRRGSPAGATERRAARPGRLATLRFFGREMRRGALAVLALLGRLLAHARRLASRTLRRLEQPTARLRRGVGGFLAGVSKALTPARVLLTVALGCALLLGLSQFADYRGVAIGIGNYDPSVQSVAPAPELERDELGSAHGYAMVPAAVLAIAVLVLAVRRGRWQLCRLAALVGVAAVVVAILVDRPAGLDEGTLVRDFAGVEARLLGGFWVQLLAGAGLAVSSLLLGAELRRARVDRAPVRGGPSRRRPAGRRRAGAEGARA